MANMMLHRQNNHVDFLSGLGQKVKGLVEFGAGMKSIYDTEKTIYSIAQATHHE